MADSQAWNTLGYAEKCLVAARASLNGVALDSEGNTKKLMNCGIDTMKISTLGEYLAEKERKEKGLVDNDKIEGLLEDKNLARTFVIPVILPNGQEVEVIVNKNGQDIACMYRDEAGNENEFQLTPRMKEQIEKSTEGLEEMVDGKVLEKVKADCLPKNLEDLAEKISDDELVPDKKQLLQKVNKETGAKEFEEDKREKEEAEKQIPAEVRDRVAKICSENDLDIRALKEVMDVQPEVITQNLDNTGINENDGKVTCLRFRDGANLQGRVVMVQGDTTVDSRKNDDYMNDYMNEHKNQKVIENIEDEHDKIAYTDVDGNTTICEISREPRDLNCSDKELLQSQMKRLDESAEYILNSDMPLEMKTQEIIKINGKRLDLFKEYGVDVPTVESEILADIEISEEVGERAAEESVEEESTGIEGYEEHYGHAETNYGEKRR